MQPYPFHQWSHMVLGSAMPKKHGLKDPINTRAKMSFEILVTTVMHWNRRQSQIRNEN